MSFSASVPSSDVTVARSLPCGLNAVATTGESNPWSHARIREPCSSAPRSAPRESTERIEINLASRGPVEIRLDGGSRTELAVVTEEPDPIRHEAAGDGQARPTSGMAGGFGTDHDPMGNGAVLIGVCCAHGSFSSLVLYPTLSVCATSRQRDA